MAPLGAPILLASRLGGMFLIAPVFAARAVPTRVRAALLIAFGVALYPSVAGTIVPVTLAALASETFIGLLIGIAAALFVGAAEMAGEWLAVQMGLAGATTVNPSSTESTPVLGNLMSILVVVLILGVDGHVVMIEALAASADVLPIGSGLDWFGLDQSTAVLGTTMFTTGLRFAAPAVAVLLTVNVALGILARTVPQLNMLMVAFPVQIGLGLLALALGMPLLTGVFGSWPVAYDGLLGDAFARVISPAALAPVGGALP